MTTSDVSRHARRLTAAYIDAHPRRPVPRPHCAKQLSPNMAANILGGRLTRLENRAAHLRNPNRGDLAIFRRQLRLLRSAIADGGGICCTEHIEVRFARSTYRSDVLVEAISNIDFGGSPLPDIFRPDDDGHVLPPAREDAADACTGLMTRLANRISALSEPRPHELAGVSQQIGALRRAIGTCGGTIIVVAPAQYIITFEAYDPDRVAQSLRTLGFLDSLFAGAVRPNANGRFVEKRSGKIRRSRGGVRELDTTWDMPSNVACSGVCLDGDYMLSPEEVAELYPEWEAESQQWSTAPSWPQQPEVRTRAQS